MNEEIQQKYMQLQMYGQQIDQMQKQLKEIEERKKEIKRLQQNISQLNHIEEGKETLFPMANGIFGQAKFTKGKLLVNVGAGVCVEKTPDETVVMLEERTKELDNATKEFVEEFENVSKQAQELEKNIEQSLAK